MTSRITSELTEFQPATLGPAHVQARPRQNPSLLMARAHRAVFRQAWLFAAVALAVTGIGVAFDVQGGLRPWTAALFWAPIGAGVAFVVAALAELSRDTVTLVSSLSKHSAYRVIGAAPDLDARALRALAPDQRSPAGCVTFQPASPFAAAHRDLQAALRNDHVVAFIAPLAGEGATTTALCAALSAVQQGRNVIVIDCDTRRRSLTKAAGADPQAGVLECCEDPSAWRTHIFEEPETGLHILPAARMRNAWRGLMEGPGLVKLIATLREAYDLVILDCPPALRSADGALLASLTERCITVAEWDRTQLGALRQTVQRLHRRSGARSAIYVNRVPNGFRYEAKRA